MGNCFPTVTRNRPICAQSSQAAAHTPPDVLARSLPLEHTEPAFRGSTLHELFFCPPAPPFPHVLQGPFRGGPPVTARKTNPPTPVLPVLPPLGPVLSRLLPPNRLHTGLLFASPPWRRGQGLAWFRLYPGGHRLGSVNAGSMNGHRILIDLPSEDTKPGIQVTIFEK